MSITQIKTIEELNDFVQQTGKLLLFKHSTTCPISAKAYDEFQSFVKENEEIPAGVVLVIEDRPVSNHIAEQFNIKHESPQIFLMDEGKVLWNTSHWKITKAAIKEALNG